jgi:LysM repeat protein
MSTAVAISWRSMDRPTTSGRGLSPGVTGTVLAGLVLLLAGCATSSYTDPMPQRIEASQRHSDAVLRQARAEANALRADLAATRIAAAKQAAELQELRLQVAEVRQANETRQAEQTALRAERDRLVQGSNELQAQVSELAVLRQTVSDVRVAEERARGRVKELETALLSMSTELEQVRRSAARRSSGKAGTKTGKAPSAGEAPSRPKQNTLAALSASPQPPLGGGDSLVPAAVTMKDPAGPGQVKVRRDETLWRIAHRHGVTVEQLRAANGLEGNLIIEAQTLVIPAK